MPKNEFTCDCSTVHGEVVEAVRTQLLPGALYIRAADFFKVLGDTTRIKIIWAIEKHEMCVCDIANLLSMTKSAVSHQLALLRSAQLVRCRRVGRTVYYSLDDGHVELLLRSGFEHVSENK